MSWGPSLHRWQINYCSLDPAVHVAPSTQGTSVKQQAVSENGIEIDRAKTHDDSRTEIPFSGWENLSLNIRNQKILLTNWIFLLCKIMFVRFPWNLSEYYSPQNSVYNLHLFLYFHWKRLGLEISCSKPVYYCAIMTDWTWTRANMSKSVNAISQRYQMHKHLYNKVVRNCKLVELK